MKAIEIKLIFPDDYEVDLKNIQKVMTRVATHGMGLRIIGSIAYECKLSKEETAAITECKNKEEK